MGNPGFYEGKPRDFAIFRGLTNGHGAPRGPTYGLRYPDGGRNIDSLC